MKMKSYLKKAVVFGTVLAAAAAMTGCYESYYSSSRYRQTPKTTAAKDTLEDFDISSFRRSDGTYQFGDLEWGSSMEAVEQALGVEISQTVAFSDGGGYGDLNYCIKLLDKVSVGLMPVFDPDEGLSCLTFYFENVYTAEELDSFYDDLNDICKAAFGEPDEVKPEERESNGMTLKCETTFWYHEISPTEMTSFQLAKTDSGRGTDAVILGVNHYNPQEETSEDGSSGIDESETTSANSEAASSEEETEPSAETEE